MGYNSQFDSSRAPALELDREKKSQPSEGDSSETEIMDLDAGGANGIGAGDICLRW